jgi:pyrimidine-nucleoside phosphorylase
MLELAGVGDVSACRSAAREQIANGKGLDKFAEMVAAQGGDARYVRDPKLFGTDSCVREVRATSSGWVRRMDTERVGIASAVLGAGRERKEDSIDPLAGIVLERKTGDEFIEGDLLATLYSAEESRLDDAEKILRDAVELGDERPDPEPLIYARVTRDGVERLS